MKRIVSVVLALVVALAMVLGTVSAGSAERLPSLTAAMTYGVQDETGNYRETVSCTARMTEILGGYPDTGGSATGTFVLTAVSTEGIGRLVGNVIYLSVEADGAKKLAYVTVEITQSTFESAPYAFVYFDDYGGYNFAFAGEGWFFDEFSSLEQNQSLTENLYGDHGQILINL